MGAYTRQDRNERRAGGGAQAAYAPSCPDHREHAPADNTDRRSEELHTTYRTTGQRDLQRQHVRSTPPVVLVARSPYIRRSRTRVGRNTPAHTPPPKRRRLDSPTTTTTPPKKQRTSITTRARLADIQRLDDSCVYIGPGSRDRSIRPGRWAYDYKCTRHDTQKTYNDRYNAYLDKRPKLLARLEDLRDKTLVCNCKNKDFCHGDVLIDRLRNSQTTTHTEPAEAPAKIDLDTHEALRGVETIPPPSTTNKLWPTWSLIRKPLLTLPFLIILVLYAGHPGPGSLAAAIQQTAPHLSRYVVEVDLLRDKRRHDILNDDLYGPLLQAARDGRILAVTGGPNCRTWSQLLSRPTTNTRMHGPLRGRPPDQLWGLPDLAQALQDKVDDDNLLLLRMLLLIHTAAKHGLQYLLEHPADPGSPHPSWWITDQCNSLLNRVGGRLVTFDACRLGAPTGKATTVATTLEAIFSIDGQRCQCKKPHRSLSAEAYVELARWPWTLMLLIAQALAASLAQDHRLSQDDDEASAQPPVPRAANAPTGVGGHGFQGTPRPRMTTTMFTDQRGTENRSLSDTEAGPSATAAASARRAHGAHTEGRPRGYYAWPQASRQRSKPWTSPASFAIIKPTGCKHTHTRKTTWAQSAT